MRAQLASSGQSNAKFLITPAPLNTIAWRIVVMNEQSYSEGFYSFLDSDRVIEFDKFAHQPQLINELKDNCAVQRMAWFTHGFYSLREVKGKVLLADLRMGQEPSYVFQFALAQRNGAGWKEIVPVVRGSRGDAAKQLPWLRARIQGVQVPPQR